MKIKQGFAQIFRLFHGKPLQSRGYGRRELAKTPVEQPQNQTLTFLQAPLSQALRQALGNALLDSLGKAFGQPLSQPFGDPFFLPTGGGQFHNGFFLVSFQKGIGLPLENQGFLRV